MTPMRRKSKDKVQHEADTIGYMPERFIEGYFELVRLGLATDPHGQQFDQEGSAPKKRFHQHAGGLRDEAALRFKAWVDRQLRAIGRDMQAYLNARDTRGPSPIGMSSAQRREIARDLERKTELKCHGCGKYISWQWAHCAWCGKEVHGSAVQDAGNGSNSGSSGSSGESAPTAHLRLWQPGGEDAPREDGGEAGPNAEQAPGDPGGGGRGDAREE